MLSTQLTPHYLGVGVWVTLTPKWRYCSSIFFCVQFHWGSGSSSSVHLEPYCTACFNVEVQPPVLCNLSTSCNKKVYLSLSKIQKYKPASCSLTRHLLFQPEQEFNDGACTLCWCPSYSTEAQCFDIQCNIPDCPNGTVTRPGDCCPSCVE